MATKTKTEKLLNALDKNSRGITAEQAVSRFGFESTAGVRSVVRNLRNQGYNIVTDTSGNVTRYRI